MYVDKGYDVRRYNRFLARHGRHRRVIERTLVRLNHFRHLTIRHERREDTHQALLDLGCALIYRRRLREAVP